MEATPSVEEQPVAAAIQEAAEVVEQVSAYGSLITNSLYLIIGGMITVFLLHKLTSKFLYPYIKRPRLMRVVFGTLYVLILIVTMLMVLNKIGIDTTVISKVAILTVLAGAVLVFFIIPFLPKLPFKIGQMIEVNGVFGNVEAISYAHTTIRTFDGAMVFIPNPIVLGSKIINYQYIPERRIALNLTVNLGADIKKVQDLLCKIMNGDKRVIAEPAPLARATTASASGVNLIALCWVKNEDFLSTQSDLWIQVLAAINSDDSVIMASPKQDIHIVTEE